MKTKTRTPPSSVKRIITTEIGRIESLSGTLTATAVLNEQTGEVSTESYIPWGTMSVEQVGDAIRLMQRGVEWACEQSELLKSNK
jgi:hypothetical protein